MDLGLHHCEVIFFWSSRVMDRMLLTFENKVPLMRYGASVVWHLSLPLMNSFIKTKVATFPSCRLCFLRTLYFLRSVARNRQRDPAAKWSTNKGTPVDCLQTVFGRGINVCTCIATQIVMAINQSLMLSD